MGLVLGFSMDTGSWNLWLGASGEPRQRRPCNNRRLHYHFTEAPKPLTQAPFTPTHRLGTRKPLPTGKLKSRELGCRHSYLAVQVDTGQSDVAIEIDVLSDGSVVRCGDQESL